MREQGAEHKKANTADFFQLLVFFEQKGGKDKEGKCFEFILGMKRGTRKK